MSVHFFEVQERYSINISTMLQDSDAQEGGSMKGAYTEKRRFFQIKIDTLS